MYNRWGGLIHEGQKNEKDTEQNCYGIKRCNCYCFVVSGDGGC